MTEAERLARLAKWEEQQAERARWTAFCQTPIGAAFAKFERAHAFAWQKDTELGFGGGIAKSANEAWARCDEARKEFLALLGYPPAG